MVQVANVPSAEPELQQRLQQLHERTGSVALQRVIGGELPFAPGVGLADARGRDAVSTALMEAYRDTRDAEVFGLLYELNRGTFLRSIKSAMRRMRICATEQDVLQEVFLNVYRYPDRFLADRADSFRVWGHRIVRNTMFNMVKAATRQPISVLGEGEHLEPVDQRERSPQRAAAEHEDAVAVDQAYLLFLNLYRHHFEGLSAKERRLLTQVEIDRRSYADIASELGCPTGNVKMAVFRARRRITTRLTCSLSGLGATA